ncbi:MAG: hypothetical protein L3J82_00925 [Planctomycetes bacterium]|nr:hypothetical protein [Planctomycetota bacterium]
MFGKPKCPVAGEPKEWLEKGMLLLANHFGLERLRDQPIVLPTDEYFPDRLDGTEEAAEACYRRVCSYMDIDPSRAEFQIFEDDAPPKIKQAMEWSHNGAVGLFTHDKIPKISIERGILADPMSLIATCAHELGHLLLAEVDLSEIEEDDEEPLTDLVTVFFGLGIFGANSAASFSQSSEEVGFTVTEWSSQGYLEFSEWGYAHALLAHARDEKKPAWIKHLRPDILVFCKQGVSYILKTGDVKFPVQID